MVLETISCSQSQVAQHPDLPAANAVVKFPAEQMFEAIKNLP
jgi:hypothetical protein